MYKYSVGSRRWILSILISSFSWASVTMFEQRGSASLGPHASEQDEDPFSSSIPSIEKPPTASQHHSEALHTCEQGKGKEKSKTCF